MSGSLVNKAEEALNYGVNERTIQREIDDIRNHLETSIEDTGILIKSFMTEKWRDTA